jgi:hypothetical protein
MGPALPSFEEDDAETEAEAPEVDEDVSISCTPLFLLLAGLLPACLFLSLAFFGLEKGSFS